MPKRQLVEIRKHPVGEIDYRDLVYSSDEEDIAKYSLYPGDLLFNRTNSAELVGKTAIYRGSVPAIYAGYLIRIHPLVNPEYLNAVMNSQYAKQYLGVNHNGHVIVLINLVSSRLMPHFKDRISKSLITVDDGGNSFGRAKVDLTSDVMIMLRMNGN